MSRSTSRTTHRALAWLASAALATTVLSLFCASTTATEERAGAVGAASRFHDALAPYGRWVNSRDYGTAWIPKVPANWRPYTEGRWVFTERWGWYWVADEPWGWAPFHYGRWTRDAQFGWMWIPGEVWGPAWVAWRHGSGYTAWAPLSPDLTEIPSAATHWVVVHSRDMLSRRSGQLSARPVLAARLLRRTNLVGKTVVEPDGVINRGIPPSLVAAFVGRRVQPMAIEPRYALSDSRPAAPASGEVITPSGRSIAGRGIYLLTNTARNASAAPTPATGERAAGPDGATSPAAPPRSSAVTPAAPAPLAQAAAPVAADHPASAGLSTRVASLSAAPASSATQTIAARPAGQIASPTATVQAAASLPTSVIATPASAASEAPHAGIRPPTSVAASAALPAAGTAARMPAEPAAVAPDLGPHAGPLATTGQPMAVPQETRDGRPAGAGPAAAMDVAHVPATPGISVAAAPASGLVAADAGQPAAAAASTLAHPQPAQPATAPAGRAETGASDPRAGMTFATAASHADAMQSVPPATSSPVAAVLGDAVALPSPPQVAAPGLAAADHAVAPVAAQAGAAEQPASRAARPGDVGVPADGMKAQ